LPRKPHDRRDHLADEIDVFCVGRDAGLAQELVEVRQLDRRARAARG